jgi:hypothetical protein
MPNFVSASVVIRRGFRGMQEGDAKEYPFPPPLLSLSYWHSREESSDINMQTKPTHKFLETNVPPYYRVYPLSITDKSKEFIKNLLNESLLTIC